MNRDAVKFFGVWLIIILLCVAVWFTLLTLVLP